MATEQDADCIRGHLARFDERRRRINIGQRFEDQVSQLCQTPLRLSFGEPGKYSDIAIPEHFESRVKAAIQVAIADQMKFEREELSKIRFPAA